MELNEFVSKLRNGETIKMYDKARNLFHAIQLNKNENFICWERFVSKDKRNWTKWNSTLSLKEAVSLREKIIYDRLKI